MRRLMILVPALMLAAGCSDELYYQTRYIPVSSEASFSASERLGWTEEREVYELPASPPDLDAEHRPRVDCTYPYQKFKPAPLVGHGDQRVRSAGGVDLTEVGDMDDRIRPSGPNVALHHSPDFGTTHNPYAAGITVPADHPQVGITDTRPHSTTGAGTTVIPATPDGGWNWNYNPYCCGDGTGAVDAHGKPVGQGQSGQSSKP